jgi:hypothetical protein
MAITYLGRASEGILNKGKVTKYMFMGGHPSHIPVVPLTLFNFPCELLPTMLLHSDTWASLFGTREGAIQLVTQ